MCVPVCGNTHQDVWKHTSRCVETHIKMCENLHWRRRARRGSLRTILEKSVPYIFTFLKSLYGALLRMFAGVPVLVHLEGVVSLDKQAISRPVLRYFFCGNKQGIS